MEPEFPRDFWDWESGILPPKKKKKKENHCKKIQRPRKFTDSTGSGILGMLLLQRQDLGKIHRQSLDPSWNRIPRKRFQGFQPKDDPKLYSHCWSPVGITFPEDSNDFNPRMIPNSTAGVRSPWESCSQKEIPRMIPNSIASYWIPVGTAFPKEDSKDFNPRTIPTFTTNHWGSVGIVKFHGDRLEILEIPTQR